MFGLGGWNRILARYRVPAAPVALAPLGIAVIGGAFGRVRNMLALGCTAQGLVLQMSGFLGSPQTAYLPWVDVQRTATPAIPIFAFPVESFLLGPERILLTVPVGHVPRG